MYEQAKKLWLEYEAIQTPPWPPDDPRHDLSGEVREKFSLLDRTLSLLDAALKAFTRSAEESQAAFDLREKLTVRLAAGEITEVEFFDAMPPDQIYANAAKDIRLFTEMFYHLAWRLLVVIGSKRHPFPGLGNLRVDGVMRVRNQLVEHPEKHDGNYRWTVSILPEAGPVLKSHGALSRGGKLEPLPESVDRGLFVNAAELRDVVEAKLEAAIKNAKS